jgi:hypothetical protein
MMRALLIGGLLAACEAEQKAAPVIVQPEPQKTMPIAEPPKLGAELVREVESAKIRCKSGIDLATEFDDDLSGEWLGEYGYDEPGTAAVSMTVQLTASSGALSGRTTERNTFVPSGVAELGASIVGEVITGGRISFMKVYDLGGATHSVLYIGKLDDARGEITGRWRTSTLTGTFSLQRDRLRG